MNEPERKPTSSAMAPGELVGLLALAVTLIAALWLAQHYLDGLGQTALEDTVAMSDALARGRFVILLGAALILSTAAVLGRLVWRIGKATIEQQHFPPEGIVSVEWRSRDGAEAVRLGELFCRVGLATGAIGVVGAIVAIVYALSI